VTLAVPVPDGPGADPAATAAAAAAAAAAALEAAERALEDAHGKGIDFFTELAEFLAAFFDLVAPQRQPDIAALEAQVRRASQRPV
jgi:hypothetical protein